MTKINLLKLNHIDNTYNNIMDFENIASRNNYFNSKIEKTFNLNLKDDPTISSITLPVNHTEINYCNYLFLTDESNNNLYFFILSYEHKTPSNTTIYIQLDVYTTYQFDIRLLPSFVERCHVPRWTGDIPTPNTIDEGISLNEYILDSSEVITSFNDGLVISSTTPLGVCPDISIPSEGGTPGGGGNNGIITKSGFRFLKGYEAFASKPLYMNNESFKTVGYGSIEGSTYYNQHLPSCSEQKASEIMADRLINDFGKSLSNQLKADNIADKINGNMFDSLLSLCYNCGAYAVFNDSTSPYLLIKQDPFNKSIETIWQNFYIKGGNPLVELEGLKLRRKAETNIYFNKTYEMRDILIAVDIGGGIGGYDGIITDNRGDGFIPSNLPDLKGNILNLEIEV